MLRSTLIGDRMADRFRALGPRLLAAAVTLLSLGAAAIGASALAGTAGGATSSRAGSARSMNVQSYMTLYGYVDNSPAGPAIAHPCLHSVAGGTGSYSDPITFATDVNELPWCTIIYVPYMARYFIHEDECGQCDQDWIRDHRYHFDMWAGGDAASRTKPERGALLSCENTWTLANGPTDPNDPTILVNPPPNLTVVSTPIFSPPIHCWQPITIATPSPQNSTIGESGVSLQLTAVDTMPGQVVTRYSAFGLPSGLSIDRTTGSITGVPTTREHTLVTVTASDAYNSTAVGFHWIVRRPPRY